jgi:amino acid adenylation domain-containing protein
MTYADLDRDAEILARRLRGLGVRMETPVGVFFERSFEMVIALVGILKAGGAYLPLHQNEPSDRFRYMLEQAGCTVVLTHDALADQIPDIGATVMNLDREPATPPGTEPVERAISPDNLAYICYTSGSTGKPKGVAVRHRGVVRLVQDGDYASLTEDETFLQLCSLRFDPSAFEIWGALLNGARLVIYRPGTPALHELADCLESERVTTLWMTTGLLHRMVDGYLDRLGGLRQLLGGGEALSPVLINRLHRTYPDLLVVNGYGPTEDTCFTSCYVVSEEVGDSVPIGRAVTDTRLYVLDEDLRPVPDGKWGLLYTSGSGLARGYVGRPELTAERFVPDPFMPGERMYAIGDLVRWVDGGVLEFRGRLDDQVKVDGYRVELGEIQSVLAGQPEVNEAVVVARDGLTPGRKILVAFVVPVKGTERLVPKLRVALHQKLPRYMHPSAIVQMEAFPETLGNKIDRKSLPALEQLPRDVDADYEAPRTPLEALLADLLTDALTVQDIGVQDEFFELGGSSLVAMDLLAHIRDVFKADVPMAEFFGSATVAGLAELIDKYAPRPAEGGMDADGPRSWLTASSNSGSLPGSRGAASR